MHARRQMHVDARTQTRTYANAAANVNTLGYTQTQMDIARRIQNELHSVCGQNQPQKWPDVRCLFKDIRDVL